MKIRFPLPVSRDARVALLAPASPLSNAGELPSVVAAASSFGFRVKEFPSLTRRLDYVAGTGVQRAADLTKAFTDPKLEAVFCLRGGYGTAHTLPHLDFKALGATRRMFAGYSDLTALLNPLATLGGLVGLHAPTMNFFQRDDEPTRISRAIFEKFLFEPIGALSYREAAGASFVPVTIRKGVAEGRLLGGNLSVFASLIGTPYEPRGKDIVLFIEEIGEKAYRLDRMLTQVIQSGFMNRVVGVVIGHLTDCGPAGNDTDDALTVVKRVLDPLRIPTLAGFPAGHERPSFPLPIGATVRLDATRGDLHIIGA
ncbi:hypothetical protein GC173_01200 [bacterium]|nr:hypothetical protein [bacterium]